MGNKKAPGPDGIPAELIKYGGNSINQIMTTLIRKIWETNTVPTDMKKAYIVLIPKKKDSKRPQDMRPITLLNSTYKLLDKLITLRLQNDIQKKKNMNEAQAGFTKNRSCPGQIFILNTIIEIREKKNTPTYCAYLDLAKAFDSVGRKMLFDTMETSKVDKEIIRILRQMYSGERSAIIINGKPRKWLKICKGVRQGGCSSPICFNFIPNDLAHEIDKSPYGVILPNGRKIGILLYADDIVLIAPSTDQMEALCKLVETWINKFKLTINVDKSEVVSYNTNKKANIKISDQILKSSGCYKYLGYTVDGKFKGLRHLKERTSKMKMSLNFFLAVIGKLKIPARKKKIIMEACIETIGLYGTEVIAETQNKAKIIEEMEIIQRKATRKILNSKTNVANEIIMNELDLLSIKSLMNLKLLKFRSRMVIQKNPLNTDILTINSRENLRWEKRCQLIMKKYEIEDCIGITTKHELIL
jgi:hypothetical protein